MFYEVQVPVSGGAALRTFQVEAPHWRAAWRTAASQVDEVATPDEAGQFAVLGPDRVVVTDQRPRRVVRIRRVTESDVHQSQALRVASGVHPDPVGGLARTAATGPVTVKDAGTGRPRTIVASSVRGPSPEPGTGRVVAETVEPAPLAASSERSALSGSGEHALESVSETALEDVFLEITTLFEPDFAMEDAIDFVLDLAMRHVPSGAGGLVFASDASDHLYFAAARGEGRQALERARLSIRDGIPAASLRDGVTIATATSSGDPRHTPELGRAAGIPIDTLCVAPVQSGVRGFGLLLLANREDRPLYSTYDANIVAYIAAQMGRYIEERLDEAEEG